MSSSAPLLPEEICAAAQRGELLPASDAVVVTKLCDGASPAPCARAHAGLGVGGAAAGPAATASRSTSFSCCVLVLRPECSAVVSGVPRLRPSGDGANGDAPREPGADRGGVVDPGLAAAARPSRGGRGGAAAGYFRG